MHGNSPIFNTLTRMHLISLSKPAHFPRTKTPKTSIAANLESTRPGWYDCQGLLSTVRGYSNSGRWATSRSFTRRGTSPCSLFFSPIEQKKKLVGRAFVFPHLREQTRAEEWSGTALGAHTSGNTMPFHTTSLLCPHPGSSLCYLPPSLVERPVCDACVCCLLQVELSLRCCLCFGRKKTIPPNVDLAFLRPAPQLQPTQAITHLVWMPSVEVYSGPFLCGCLCGLAQQGGVARDCFDSSHSLEFFFSLKKNAGGSARAPRITGCYNCTAIASSLPAATGERGACCRLANMYMHSHIYP